MESTKPKPFVFVLMPFDSRFDDIYRFGIKGAAEDAEAYAERVDEQTFVEGILDRILNQINKADVIVADMTGKNANVFYEVGYAHALDKIVLLTTQNADDIPFDLKHRPHVLYGGSIEKLRRDLGPRIRWAISESTRRHSATGSDRISVRLAGLELPQAIASEKSPEIRGAVNGSTFVLPLHLRNDSSAPLHNVSHIYLFASEHAQAVPAEIPSSKFTLPSTYHAPYNIFGTEAYAAGLVVPFDPRELTHFAASEVDAPDGLKKQYRLPITFGSLPPGAIEGTEITFLMKARICRSLYRLRLHTADRFYDFGFQVNIEQKPELAEPSGQETKWRGGSLRRGPTNQLRATLAAGGLSDFTIYLRAFHTWLSSRPRPSRSGKTTDSVMPASLSSCLTLLTEPTGTLIGTNRESFSFSNLVRNSGSVPKIIYRLR